MTTRILGVSGKRGAGKDSVFKFLERSADLVFPGWHVRRVGFADRIKELIIAGFHANRETAFGDDAAKEAQLPNAVPGVTYRDGMKTIGQAYAELNPMHWVQCAMDDIDILARYHQPLLVVVTDVRFPKEVRAIQSRGGKVVRLTRAVRPDDTSGTETALDSYLGFDAVVDNREMAEIDKNVRVLSHLKQWGWTR